MDTLENETLIKSVDSENMLQSLMDMPDQIADACRLWDAFVLPTHFVQAKQIVILGVEAGAIAAHLVKELAQAVGRVPVEVVERSELPAYVSSQSLVVGIDYSGQTEEILEGFRQAGGLGAKLLGVSAGGELGALCRKYRAPHFHIQYGAPSRAALGYLLIPLLGLLARLGHVELDRRSLDQLPGYLRSFQARLVPKVPEVQNPAKQLARQLSGKLPHVIASGLLMPVARRWQEQLAQNAHSHAIVSSLAQFSHSLVAGLDLPTAAQDLLVYVQLRSSHDGTLASLQQNLLARLFGKLGRRHEELVPSPQGSVLEEQLALIVWGDYVSYYLALLGGVDPAASAHMMFLVEQSQGNTDR
ncbi:hypothetical protein HY375_02225 [Candidatus Berkelbacteria bacterium]|nr:hypothetical protein [Candidatus Berkelbacteria bacterium]